MHTEVQKSDINGIWLDPLSGDIPLSGLISEGFWVRQNCIPEPMSGCWVWTGATDHNGYGLARRNGKNERAHRLSWSAHAGVDPIGSILHACHNAICVNPDHPYEGTHYDNMQDRAIANKKKLVAGDWSAVKNKSRYRKARGV